MQSNTKNRLQIILIIGSILLLMLFQFFWIRQNYFEQKKLLKENIGRIFTATITELQDSMIVKQMQVPLAKAMQKKPVITKPKIKVRKVWVNLDTDNRLTDSVLRTADTLIRMVRISLPRKQMPDSVKKLLARIVSVVQQKSSNSRLIVSLNADSTKNFTFYPNKSDTNIILPTIYLKKINAKVKSKPILKKAAADTLITFSITQDLLRKVDVVKAFREKLFKSAINLPFEVSEQPKNKTPIVRSGMMVEGISYSKIFLANFNNYEGYLFQKIIPQTLFSLFLITVTAGAFWLIFSNLQQQKRLTLLKNDLISNITHELKTPISTVSVAIEALRSFGGLQNPELTKEYLEISKNELNRLSILVDDVLKMAILEQQQPNLNLSEIDLKNMLERVLNTLKLTFENRQAKVKFETYGQDFTFLGDEIHLTNVVYNLLDNALKYNTNTPEITVTLAKKPNHFTLNFADNGNGIPKEFQKKIFEKFFRVPTGNTHNTKGYGLGLSYVKTIVEQHKGTINLVSTQGVGSEFEMTFPKK